ncbi:predicted protein [Verticillium alfalfae VaMs.102]|uniref:Predicted protein n=1 Tax=Verticillium alfalfae (strain VaMs.102 / ATCC MYA-4576 / FGSC 10136) TaxID=526221 RepID=C9SC01_VERA1|nr:predicted protein [Verticillium alfalfae VaMs.102]EEY15885.1 predicted protein [Verticillium alfalfae VaMs.102]
MYRHASRPLLGLGRPSLAVMSRQQVRTYAKKERPNANRAALRANQRVSDTAAAAQSGNMMKQQKEAIEQATTRYAGSLFPGTFIPVPLSRAPRAPSAFLGYQYTRIKSFASDFLSTFVLRFQSRPSFFKKPRADLYRARARAAGTALHARLGHALAAGDREALRAICTPALYETLGATLDKRSRHERTTWDVVATHRTWLAAHRVGVLPPPLPKDTMIQQAVVAVDSTQRLDRVDVRTGLSIPGAARVQRRTEYLAITRRWNGSTYVAGDWKVIGNASETTPESWAQEQARIAAMEAENADKKLREAGIQ